MMSIPTQEDALLMVELFKLRLEPFLQESETWFATQFQPESWESLKAKYPQGSKEWRMLTTVLGYWELLGALLDHNLLSEDLLFDAIESVDLTWDKVKDWLPHARLDMGSDLWENIELLVTRQRRWRLVRVPKAEQA
jgi:hypothetical protein